MDRKVGAWLIVLAGVMLVVIFTIISVITDHNDDDFVPKKEPTPEQLTEFGP